MPLLAPPRLPPRIEHRVLWAACRLPAPLQRLLVGAPVERDGQVLAADIQAFLRLAELTGESSISAAGTAEPAAVRLQTEADAAVATGPLRPLAAVTDLSVPGPAGPLPARLYEPDGLALEERPLIVYFHGGGWVIGSLDTHDGLCRLLAAEVGAAVLSVGYRLAPEHPFPAAYEDAVAAFAWATGEGRSRLGADPARVAVAGDSAGGNLAAAVAIAARDAAGPQPAMQALIYPVTDAASEHASRRLFAEGFMLTKADMDWFERHYLPPEADRADPRISVLRSADLSGLAPAYVATAGFDPLRDEGEEYARRLGEAGVRVALRRHPGLIHSFANLSAVSPTALGAMRELCGALRMGLA